MQTIRTNFCHSLRCLIMNLHHVFSNCLSLVSYTCFHLTNKMHKHNVMIWRIIIPPTVWWAMQISMHLVSYIKHWISTTGVIGFDILLDKDSYWQKRTWLCSNSLQICTLIFPVGFQRTSWSAIDSSSNILSALNARA